LGNKTNGMMNLDYLFLCMVLIGGMIFSVRLRKLTNSAAITGGICGWLIYLGSGFAGLTMLAVFFLVGSFATSWKFDLKEKLALAEKSQGRRNAGQVIANAGVAALLGLVSTIIPLHLNLVHLMIASSFASAISDTLSSELGNLYGKNYFNIITFKKEQRGLNGVVSMEGTLFGLAGALLIAIIYSSWFGWSQHFVWIIIAGTIGNISDSVFGATLERKNILDNDAVNFLNTLIAALVAMLLYRLIG
jgi:uncharacterized protein (TIGR00297 family)